MKKLYISEGLNIFRRERQSSGTGSHRSPQIEIRQQEWSKRDFRQPITMAMTDDDDEGS